MINKIIVLLKTLVALIPALNKVTNWRFVLIYIYAFVGTVLFLSPAIIEALPPSFLVSVA